MYTVNRRVFPIKISGSEGRKKLRSSYYLYRNSGRKYRSWVRALRARNILKFSSGERDNGPAERGSQWGADEWVSHVKTNFDPKTTGDRGVVVAVAKHYTRHANTVNNRLVEQSDNARWHNYRYLCGRTEGGRGCRGHVPDSPPVADVPGIDTSCSEERRVR